MIQMLRKSLSTELRAEGCELSEGRQAKDCGVKKGKRFHGSLVIHVSSSCESEFLEFGMERLKA